MRNFLPSSLAATRSIVPISPSNSKTWSAVPSIEAAWYPGRYPASPTRRWRPSPLWPPYPPRSSSDPFCGRSRREGRKRRSPPRGRAWRRGPCGDLGAATVRIGRHRGWPSPVARRPSAAPSRHRTPCNVASNHVGFATVRAIDPGVRARGVPSALSSHKPCRSPPSEAATRPALAPHSEAGTMRQ